MKGIVLKAPLVNDQTYPQLNSQVQGVTPDNHEPQIVNVIVSFANIWRQNEVKNT